MRSVPRFALAFALPLITALAWLGVGAPHSVRAQTMQVRIQNFSFQPGTVTVPVGSTVTWTNQDTAPHTATADDNSWTTATLQTGQSGSITFNTPGTFPYHCAIHPFMHGTLIVQASAGTPGTTATSTPSAGATPTSTSIPLAAYPVLPITIMVRTVHASLRFVPSRTTVRAGTLVTWTNTSRSALTIMGRGTWHFNSGRIPRHRSASYLFSRAGTYRYWSPQHPSVHGTIVVHTA